MNISEFAACVKARFEEQLRICDAWDELNCGTKKYNPDKSSREFYQVCTMMYAGHLIGMDQMITEEESKWFRTIFPEYPQLSTESLWVVIKNSVKDWDEFLRITPFTLRAAIEYDNENAKDRFTSVDMYDTYAALSVLMMFSDTYIGEEEYQSIYTYLDTMYHAITQGSNKEVPELRTPSAVIRHYLEELDIPDEVIQRSPARKEEAEDGSSQQDSDAAANEEPEESLDMLLDQLNNLIGLDEVKYEVTSLVNLSRVKRIREQNGLTFPAMSLHLVFSGNPGTGKTTVARLLAKIYRKIGVLSKGHLVEVDRSGLVGGYVGQTALKVQEVIKQASGGVLFIDEAYSLTNRGNSNDYGTEAVDTIVKAMEDHRDDLIVIAAGYPGPMKEFVNSNPGLRSRFNKTIYFPDYTPEELLAVFRLFCQQNSYRPTLDALDYTKKYYEERCSAEWKREHEVDARTFGNARDVRNFFEQAMMRQANRVVMLSTATQKALTLLTYADVSGRTEDLGRDAQLAQAALDRLPMAPRLGIPEEYMACLLDQLELPVRVRRALEINRFRNLNGLITYLERGGKLTELREINAEMAAVIYAKLQKHGYNGPVG